MKKILLLTAAGLIFQVTPVLAQPYGDGSGMGGRDGKSSKMFEKHDADGDGVISESEFLEHAKVKFDERDTDGNGSISKDEARAAHEAKRKKRQEMKEKWKEKRQERLDKSE